MPVWPRVQPAGSLAQSSTNSYVYVPVPTVAMFMPSGRLRPLSPLSLHSWLVSSPGERLSRPVLRHDFLALLPGARDDGLISAAGSSTPDDAPARIQGGSRTRGPRHNDAKSLLDALRHVCRRSACGARDAVLLTRLQDTEQPCLHLRISRIPALP